MLHDLRYACRTLASSPVFTIAAVSSLAIGIGINTTIFTLVNAILLRPLPVAEPQRLVEVYTKGDIEHSTTSWLDYEDLRDANNVFSGLVGHSLMLANITRDGRSGIVLGEVVTANYFEVFGIRPAVGRAFTQPEEALEGGSRVVVLGNGCWRREFAADPAAVGRTLRLRGVDYTIIGIAPSNFGGMTPGVSTALWIPASMVDDVEPVGNQDVVPSPTGKTRLQRRGQRWLSLKGRLKPGVTASQAQIDISRITARLEEEHPATNKGRRGLVVPAGRVRIHPLIDGALTSAGALLMIAVGLVLVIACANIANMLLARTTVRTREIAVRLAIGAGRGRIIRQLLTESAVLAALGGVVGALLAGWATGVLAAYQPPLPVALPLDLEPDWRVFAFVFCVSLATGGLFGLAPAIQSTGPDLVSALKMDVAGSQSRGRFPLRSALVVAEVAVCFVLLVGTGLLLRSLAAARSADVGFDPRGLVVTTVDVAMHRYSPDRGREFYRQALIRLQALPGVTSAALVERLPFSPNIHAQTIFIDGRAYTPEDRGAITDVTRVTAGYFPTMGIPLLQGRDFDGRDTPDSPGVVIVNDTLARRYWPGHTALGKRIRIRAADGPVFEIVGVSANHKVRTVGEAPRPFVHFSRDQSYSPSASLIARTAGAAESLVQPVRQALTGLEPELVFLENQTMESAIATTLFPARIGTLVLSVAGGIALLLAAIGLYGLIAFSVTRRTREIGIRVALGADPRSVLGLVLRQGMALVLVGLAAGTVLALVATRALQGALYGIGPADPVSFGVAFALLTSAALAANLIPALRASRTDPMVALRTGV